MNKKQILKATKLAEYVLVIMMLVEGLFLLPNVTEFFTNWVNDKSGFWLYLIIFLLMFLQGTILPIPALVIIQLSIKCGIDTLTWQYILTVMIAYMSACILSYWLGRWFGTKAVKWIAGNEEEYNKWCNFLGEKGKWLYAATVLLPIFPDDILCIVAGSVKMNFGFYTIVNIVCKLIGLITMLWTLKITGIVSTGNSPVAFIVYFVLFFVILIFDLVYSRKI